MAFKVVKHIFLDSRYKNAGTTNYMPSWNLPTGQNQSGHQLISLQSCIIPNLVFPVTSLNNTIIFAEGGGGNLTATLTPQDYTGTTLASTLQSVLNTVGALTYTVTFDILTTYLTIAVSSSTLQFKTSDSAFTAGFVLGFDEKNDSADSGSISSDFPIRLDGSMYIDIELTNANTHSMSVNNSSTPFIRIPLTSSFGSIVNYEASEASDNVMTIDTTGMNNLDLRIRDDQGRNWLLPDNAYCSFVFNMYDV